MLRFVLAFALASATPVWADPMSGTAFDAYTKGKTLYFGRGGQSYGAEVYLDNKRVRWSFLDGQCKDGYWYENAPGEICFVYEDRPDAQCWSFELSPNGLIATFLNDPQTVDLYEARDSDEEMVCLGPKVGV